MSLLHSGLSLVDGIEVGLSNMCVPATSPQVRALFEHLIAVEYIAQSDDKYNDRSYAWFVFRIKQKLDYLDLVDPGTEKGKQFRAERAHDTVLRDVGESIPTEEIAEERKRLTSLLAEPHLAPHRDVMLAGRPSARGKDPFKYWYQMYGGPTSIFHLASAVDRVSMYRLFYSLWSRDVHATGGLAFRAHEGEVVFQALRDPKAARDSVVVTAGMAIDMMNVVREKFRPGEDWQRWYRREIAEHMLALAGAV